MKAWLAEVVECGVNLLCALSNHAFGCAVWRALMVPYVWASETRNAVSDYPERHDCPICGKEKAVPTSPEEWELVDSPTVTTSSATPTVTRNLTLRRRGDAA